MSTQDQSTSLGLCSSDVVRNGRAHAVPAGAKLPATSCVFPLAKRDNASGSRLPRSPIERKTGEEELVGAEVSKLRDNLMQAQVEAAAMLKEVHILRAERGCV